MDIGFRQATPDDVSAMVALWKLCFPEDDEAFIHRFFAEFPAECGLVACKGDLLAMLFLLPAAVVYRDKQYPVRYLYAGCTHPAYRNRGIYTRLLSFAAEQAALLGARAIYLHPASDSLVEYYKRCGYRSGIGEWGMDGTGRNGTDISAEDYVLKRAALAPSDTPVWQLSDEGNLFFLREMLADGWSTMGNEFFCGLLSQDGNYGYDCHGAACGKSAVGVSGTEFRNTAMWLPIGDSPLHTIMDTKRGYTAFLGDI
ncbi:MAG: GNAT family N-acetyltransferase [Clostridia bacterium]|nr:GNAT family N-acetyltransferase [Clostridia bacterium]